MAHIFHEIKFSNHESSSSGSGQPTSNSNEHRDYSLSNNPSGNIIIFDSDPFLDETTDATVGLHEIAFLDDRTFVIDDEEYARLKAQLKLDDLLKDSSNYYVVNETPNKLPKSPTTSKILNSSLTRPNSSSNSFTSSNMSEHQLNIYVGGDSNLSLTSNSNPNSRPNSFGYENEPSKTTLLDAFVKKFNIDERPTDNRDLFYSDEMKHEIVEEIQFVDGKEVRICKEKILLNSFTKTNPTNTPTNSQPSIISTSNYEPVKNIVEPLTTTSSTSYSNLLKQPPIIELPQTFECKYLGKSACRGLWGKRNIREPIDRLVRNAKRLRSVNELSTVRVTIGESGIDVMEYNIGSSNYQTPPNTTSNNYTPKNGIIPISNISYAAQDNVYGKIFACIVVQEKDQTSECYAFLLPTKEMCRRMALTITSAFQKYAIYLNSISNYHNKPTTTSSRLYNWEDSGNFRDSYA